VEGALVLEDFPEEVILLELIWCPLSYLLFPLQDLHVPNEDRIKQLLGQDAWTSQKSELAGFYPRLMAKSDTGKIGLINLGNTCYVNSILQALFMASE
jgi:hypothetical protein